jgi:hypothetical protein
MYVVYVPRRSKLFESDWGINEGRLLVCRYDSRFVTFLSIRSYATSIIILANINSM